ncbi:hypothetical protein [Solirubrum puertoriconensis]|uniref:Uncharacterized protein n=1 Tax=Solirubrum puertoriconensis TaxID=1751427 RepID=A0A9X0HNH7_SOLP1|nr:hypothetical protein [Solirubrum puertoriconensis]KUG09285.1 hypothetical protein ASU33_16220 [Solirubrum puertoriconensis]
MQDTYSNDQLLAYGRQLAARLCDQYFATQPVGTTLDGPAVLRLAPIRQLNLYVVQQLLAQWTQEMARLRSPYFDYEDAAVRQALTQLMNLLSRRIKLTRATYEPLLALAVADTLRTALDPAAIFESKLLPAEQAAVTPAQLRDALRYVEVNKPLYQDFIDSLPADLPQERDALLTRFRVYSDAHYQEVKTLSALLSDLSPLLPVTASELRQKPSNVAVQQPAPEPAVTAVATAAPAVHEAQNVTDAVTNSTAAPQAAAPEPVAEPVPPAEPLVVHVATPVATAPPAPSEAIPVPPRTKPLVETVQPINTLNDKLASNRPVALGEKLGVKASSNTIAEAQPKIDSLRGAISINQRFSFINELFNGENMEYHAAIEHLDSLANGDAARSFVTEELAQRYQWVRKEEHVNKLLRLIERKFA